MSGNWLGLGVRAGDEFIVLCRFEETEASDLEDDEKEILDFLR